MKTLASFPLVFFAVFLLMVGFSHSASAQAEIAATPTSQTYLAVQGENIAALGSVEASAKNSNLGHVNDGDAGTMWTARDFAPQWFSIEFEEFHLVNKIELVLTQSEAGLTTHEIWLGDDSHTTTPYKRFDNFTPRMGRHWRSLSIPRDALIRCIF